MKSWRTNIFLCIICIALIFNGIAVYAHPEASEHDKELESILFEEGYSKYQSNDIKNSIKALEMASYLAIDQFEGKGENQYLALKKMKLGGLPTKFSSIDYNHVPGSDTKISANTHRRYTHQGWDRNYSSVNKETDNFWKTRRKILLGTVNGIFKFDKITLMGYSEKCNSLAGIIYYIHILGDYNEADKYTKIATLTQLAGRSNANTEDMDMDVITSLKGYIEVLFVDQKSTYEYKALMKGLQDIEKKAGKIANSVGGVNTDEEFEEYHAYADDVMQLLKEYLPKLLKNEDFFSKVFYPKQSQ